MKLRLTCREATALVLQGMDRQMRPLERFSLRMHWLVCDGCRRFRRQADLMRRAFDRFAAYREDPGPDS